MGLFDELLKKPPQPANDGTATAGSQTQGSSAVVSESDPLQIQTPITKTEEQAIATEGTTPSATPTVSIEPSTPATTAETDASSILVNSEPSEETTPVVDSVSLPTDAIDDSTTTPLAKEEAPAAIVSESAPAENVDLGSLFGEDIPAETEIEVTPAPSPERTDSIDESEFVNLNEYIETNISQTESLIAKIDGAHTEKLEEAAGYKSEKERFAGLEEAAYEEAEKMMVEKAHTERMKSYFMEQLDEAVSSSSQKKDSITPVVTSSASAIDEPPYDEAPMYDDVMLMEDANIDGSVETALTGIAVQSTVKSTMEKKHKTKKQEEKKDDSLMAMISE